MGINLLTFNQKTVTPKDDALIQQFALGQDGFFYGGAVTYAGGNTLHFASGEGVICGREFVIEDTDVSAALPASGTLLGQIYIHIDLSNADTPIELICETAAELTELTKDENMNVDNGEYDLQLCTFTATTSAITDLSSKVTYIKKGGAGSNENLATVENESTSSQAYVAGQHLVYDDVYCEVIESIAENDAFVVYPADGANIKPAKVGDEIFAINQNLTHNVMIYNDADDYFYLNGVKTIYRGYQNVLVVFANGTFGKAMSNGVYHVTSAITGVAPFTITPSSITGTAQVIYQTLVTNDLIDFSSYDYLKMKTNLGDITVNLGNINTSGYVTVALGNSYLALNAVSEKENFLQHSLAQGTLNLSSGTNVIINEITLE